MMKHLILVCLSITLLTACLGSTRLETDSAVNGFLSSNEAERICSNTNVGQWRDKTATRDLNVICQNQQDKDKVFYFKPYHQNH